MFKMSTGFFIKQSEVIELCIMYIHGDDWITESMILNEPDKSHIKYAT